MRIIANNNNDSWDNFEFAYEIIQNCSYALDEMLSIISGRNNENYEELNSLINYYKKDKEWCRKKLPNLK